MYIVKFCLVFVIILQYTQFSSCESSEDDEESTAVLSPRPVQDEGLERTQRAANKLRCSGNRKACIRLAGSPRISRKQIKQCKKKDKKCKKKRDRRCKNNLKCYKKKTKKCKRRNKSCLAPRNDRPPSPPSRSTSTNINTRSPVIPDPTSRPFRQKHETCVKDTDCLPDHCCARYRTIKRCQERVPLGGVCPIPLNKNRRRSAQFFERCPCASGLYCRESLTGQRHYTCQIAT